MYAVMPSVIPAVDRYAAETLGIPTEILMRRAGAFVAERIRASLPAGATVIFFCGSGNNGGDGYAAAALLKNDYRVFAVDVFGAGQKSAAGNLCLASYRADGGTFLTLAEAADCSADCLVDAVFGTGGRLPLPPEAECVARIFNSAKKTLRLSIDIPLGINGENGRAADGAVTVDATLCLTLPKIGLYSYPARERCGEIAVCDLGLPVEKLAEVFGFCDRVTDEKTVGAAFPCRAADTHKGSYGHLLMLCGSDGYRGAAVMAGLAAASLRMGAGLVTLASEESVLAAVMPRVPEVISHRVPAIDGLRAGELAALTEKKTAILLGSGLAPTEALYGVLTALLGTEGAPLVLDAGALGALAMHREDAEKQLIASKRQVIFTPHPAEFARMIGKSVAEVQADRLSLSRAFAERIPGVLVLKGAATVIAEKGRLAVNPTGGPSLAKGGSGDILAGAVASLAAQKTEPFEAASAAVYLHGAAGDRLARRFSEHGVLPTDLPAEMAAVLSDILRGGAGK